MFCDSVDAKLFISMMDFVIYAGSLQDHVCLGAKIRNLNIAWATLNGGLSHSSNLGHVFIACVCIYNQLAFNVSNYK